MKYQAYYPRIILLIFLLVAACIGYLTARDYGLSWDELGIYDYSEDMLTAYDQILRPWNFESQVSDSLLNLYGPSHFMFSTIFSRYLSEMDKSWLPYQAHHLFYFLTFLLSIPAFYFLCARWMSEWAALGTVILFSTQPLFWGNAFINPKDIPFMAFFIIAVYLGFVMVDSKSNSIWWKIIIAGIVLGLTTSIRSFGLIAGAFAIFYSLRKDFRNTLRFLPLYLLTTAITTYLSWPYLWSDPLNRFIESITTMSKHPVIFYTLFMGEIYLNNELPFFYFPTFVALQLTIPALILCAVGTRNAFQSFIRKTDQEPFLLFLLWFLLPTIAIGLSDSTIYDNARQLYFLIPPLFILAGMGIDTLLHQIKSPLLQIILALILISPAMYANVRLHPYQYIYYNELIGGVSGAFRKFDLDYSGTSFKEALQWINENSSPSTQTFIIIGPRHLARIYIRPALKDSIFGEFDSIQPNGSEYYYVLLLTRTNSDLHFCPNGDIVYSIERDNGVLAYIKKIYSKEPCW
jgi:4-amino-4-deoxy-L-arabinose transferase-like glycosyltransferase